jgi:hypothetical protein
LSFPQLNFPGYNFKLQKASPDGQSIKIFDIVRKKFLLLTPEEWVRQHLIHYLVNDRQFPLSLLSVEKKIVLNGLTKRTDIVAFGMNHKPFLLAECKAPDIIIDQKVFDQAARYNMVLNTRFYVLSNGLQTYCCEVDHVRTAYNFLPGIPSYDTMSF